MPRSSLLSRTERCRDVGGGKWRWRAAADGANDVNGSTMFDADDDGTVSAVVAAISRNIRDFVV